MDPDLLLTVNVPGLSLAARLLPDQAIRVARLFDGLRPLRAVLAESHLTPRMTVAVVSRLRQAGLLLPLDSTSSLAAEAAMLGADTGSDPAFRALLLGDRVEAARDEAPDREPGAGWADAILHAHVPVEDEPDVIYRESARRPLPAPPASDPGALPTVIVAPELLEAAPPEPAAFEDADERFFGSYQPEAPPEDFSDLEDRPLSRRRASARTRRGRVPLASW